MAMSISSDHTQNEFQKGNYIAVAQCGEESNWRTHAARGLIHVNSIHTERLAAFDGEEENFFRAVLYWMDHDEKKAISVLENLSLPAAQRLLKILDAPKIRVISQLIEHSPSPFALFRGVSCDDRFDLINIDLWPHPEGQNPSTNVYDYLDPSDPPAFFISTMVEWHPLLDNLNCLNCPIFGHVVDYDMAFQTLLPSLQQFDELIVGGGYEKNNLERLTGKQATVYPQFMALDDKELPELSQLTSDDLDVDVIMTGTTVDYFHPDKRNILSSVLISPNLNPLFVHGYLPKKFYFQSYRRAHIVISWLRFNDGSPGQGPETRLLEALAVGRPVFTVGGLILDQVASVDVELFQTDMKSGVMLRDLVRAIEKEKNEPVDRVSTAKRFRHIYGHQNTGSRYLRFLTFRAAMNENVNRTVVDERAIHQRVTGWTGFPKISDDLRKKTMSILAEKCCNADDWKSRLAAAREFILSAAEAGRNNFDRASISQTLNRGTNLLREIILIRPQILAAHFNLIRALLHLGDEAEKIEAINLLDQTLSKPSQSWELSQFDNVMPFDFFPHMFDYRNYLNSLANLENGEEEQSRRKKMVFASLRAYRGWFDGNAEDFHEAKRLNPEFINYRLWSARADMTNGDWVNIAELRADLEAASFDPLTCQQATHLLWTFKDRLYEKENVPQKISEFAERNEQCVLYVGEPEGVPGSIYESGWHLPGNTFNSQRVIVISEAANTNPLLSVIIAPRPRRNYQQLFDSLSVQTLDKEKFRVILAEPFGVIPHETPAVVDEIICCGQMGVFEHLNRCYNLALSRVRSPLVLIIDETGRLPNEFLTLLLDTFKNGPEGPLVIAKGDGKNKASILQSMRLYQEATIAFRTIDLISVGGYDEAASFFGLLSGPFDAAHRIAQGTSNLATIDIGIREEKNCRYRHALVAEYLSSLYNFGRTLPYVEQDALRKLRIQGHN